MANVASWRALTAHLKLIGNLLEQLKISELKKYPETRNILRQLEDAAEKVDLWIEVDLYCCMMEHRLESQTEMRYLKIVPHYPRDNSVSPIEVNSWKDIEKDHGVYWIGGSKDARSILRRNLQNMKLWF
ncbi:hypothetical protein CUMW_151750 [Citrus unshiu]|nr:hypothetical protein CUMW_151750 [Citrus unshiu]